MRLLDRIARPDVLYAAWEEVRAGDEADGVASTALLDFRNDLSHRIDNLRTALLEGSFVADHVTRIDIPKQFGGIRTLRLPSIRDRVVERALCAVLHDVLDPEFSPWSFAYRPGLSVQDALTRLVELRDEGRSWMLRADLKDCFDSIDRALLIRYLGARVRDPAIVGLVALLLRRPTVFRRRVERTTRGTAQGAPLSPILCNAYLTPLDLAMARDGFAVVRFADDMAILGGSRSDCEAALEALKRHAKGLSLMVNPDKTRIGHLRDGGDFLGVHLDDEYPRLREARRTRPDRKVLYVGVQGASVRMRGGQLRVVEGRDEDLLTVPAGKVGRIVLIGSVGLSAQAREHALRKGIDVCFISRRGAWQGRLESGAGDPGIRRRHFEFASDRVRAVAVARACVQGKIANQRALLLRYGRRSDSPTLFDAADSLSELRAKAWSHAKVESLLGVEGTCARIYYSAWSSLLPTDVKFQGRNRRPPKDPVNAALSFGYTMLVSDCVAAVRIAGLDPAVGFLHQHDRDRPSLALDLAEEFRPLIVDSMVLESFRRGALQVAGFTTDSQTGAVNMTEATRRTFIDAYERRMLTRFAHVPSGTRTWYRRAVHLQAMQLRSVVTGLEEEYRPVPWR